MLLLELFRLDERIEPLSVTLEPFKEARDVYVTYSDIEKVGVNPQTGYNTPVGVYAYPLRPMFGDVITRAVPFAGDRNYVHVLQATGRVLDLFLYSQADYERDADKLMALYGNRLRISGKFLDFIRSELPREGWPDDPLDALRFIGSSPERVFGLVREFAEGDARQKTPGGMIWNLTREIAQQLIEGQPRPGGGTTPRAAIIWNQVLRALGYGVIDDRMGQGIIHRNEPIQAVFLYASAARHLATFHNVTSKWNYRNEVEKITTFHTVITLFEQFMDEVWDDAHAMRKRHNRIVRMILDEWQRLRETGKSEHFEFAANYSNEQLSKDIERNWNRFAESALTLSDRLVPILVWEIMRNPLLQSPRVLNEVLSRIGGSGDFASYARLLDDDVLAVWEEPEWVKDPFDNEDARTKVSRALVLKAAEYAPPPDKEKMFRSREHALAVMRKRLAPLRLRLAPETVTDDSLIAAVERMKDSAIPF